jgi:hypothetical protein
MTVRRKLFWPWGAALALAAGSTAPAHATARHVSLRWNAPDSCPDDAALLDRVEGYLGQRLAEALDQQLAVSIHVLQAPDGFSAKLGFVTPGGRQERFLEHPECDKLMEAAALLVALAIDPERVRARQEVGASNGSGAAGVAADGSGTEPGADSSKPAPEGSPAPPTVSSSAPLPANMSPAVAQPPADDGHRVHPSSAIGSTLAVVALAGVGTVPGFAPGVAAELGLRRGLFRAALVGRYWLPSTSEVAGAAPASIELSLATAGVRACVLPRAGQWTLLGCAGADVGSMSGSGHNVSSERPQSDLFVALEGSLALAYSRAQLAPLAGLAITLPVRKPRFGVLRDGIEIEGYRPNGVGLAGFLGVAYGL